MARPRWNVERERQAETWARGASERKLRDQLVRDMGSTYWYAARLEVERRETIDALKGEQ